ncbi:UDP-N-acetylmuramoyl-tripeptide--D-alanyl-D-alanine ligase [Marinospirillum insulare]|uniref:UDP-N-acetylmuramoyl-tripeptide--D-alanyl-D-alanine ligase n=1 Tax=Marinospirillum insulare TaxID=217169 RepID=A0ABQ5ZVT7_9GAMM|nr:UDP-N-acetylmuramoyl-tripeptide--D-alanyl-D-alanine ligase [Marinospirillum insulare]GLR63148.1 UDP-N-acetylmuramoyl-tripeptide--D-alanyl-D-alanine ligase [Marinospirillum insulare]
MIQSLDLHTLATCVAGELKTTSDQKVNHLSIDARQVVSGSLFAALVGERVDGHDFLDQAKQNQASAALVERWQASSLPQVKVASVTKALGDLARYNRQMFTGPLVAVTGNSGKTSVKEILAAILSAHFGEVLATQGNLNNELGVPLTLTRLEATHKAAVVELGANHLGEISKLAKMTQPDLAIITNVTGAHLGEFGSLQAIAQAKAELIEATDPKGCLVLNADDEFYDFWREQAKQKVISFGFSQAQVSASQLSFNKQGGSEFYLVTPWGEQKVSLQLLGKHNIANALAAIAAAGELGVPLSLQLEVLQKLQPVKGRLARVEAWAGALLLDDSYNASPGAVKSAIDLLAKLPGKKLLALGSLAELGAAEDSIHAELGLYARSQGIDGLFALQGKASLAAASFGEGGQVAADHQALAAILKPELNPATCLLVKGSRSARMDKLVALLSKKDTT